MLFLFFSNSNVIVLLKSTLSFLIFFFWGRGNRNDNRHLTYSATFSELFLSEVNYVSYTTETIPNITYTYTYLLFSRILFTI